MYTILYCKPYTTLLNYARQVIKEDKKMTDKEKLMAEIRRLQDENQDKFIDALAEKVEYLCEKANAKSYEPTVHEKQVFANIVTIIDNMKEWF